MRSGSHVKIASNISIRNLVPNLLRGLVFGIARGREPELTAGAHPCFVMIMQVLA
jgi:hypothetical protein